MRPIALPLPSSPWKSTSNLQAYGYSVCVCLLVVKARGMAETARQLGGNGGVYTLFPY